MAPNVELLNRTLAHIEQHPDEWKQSHYRCGSGMCFAGWAATFAGGQWATEDADAEGNDELVAELGDAPGHVFNGQIWAMHRAQRVLGLSFDQAALLFASTNRLYDLRRIVGEIVAEES